MIYEHKHIAFGIENYNTLGLIRSLGEHGVKPICILIQGGSIRLASKSKWIGELHFVDSIEEGYKVIIQLFSAEINKPFLYACDDKTTSFLDHHYHEIMDKFYFSNAGKDHRVTYYMNKNNINILALKYGLNVLNSWVVQKGGIPEDIEYPVITKSISSIEGGWKDDVFICQNEEELTIAYEKIKSETVLLQKYLVKKNELCLDGIIANHGDDFVITIAATYNYILPDKYSNAMTFTNFTDSKLNKKINNMLREVGYTGIFCIEFLLDDEGKLYFCEVNFRNSGWSYASTRAGMPLPVLWAKACLGELDTEQCIVKIPKGFTAIVEFSDFDTRVRGKMISFGQWLKEVRSCNCLFYIGQKDWKPFFSFFYAKFIGKLGRMLHIKK